MAAVTNDHKVGCLKQQRYILSRCILSWFRGWKPAFKIPAGLVPLESSRGASVPCFFQLQTAIASFGLWPHHSNLYLHFIFFWYLHFHTAFSSLCGIYSDSLFEDTCGGIWGPLGYQGKPHISRSLINHTCTNLII